MIFCTLWRMECCSHCSKQHTQSCFRCAIAVERDSSPGSMEHVAFDIVHFVERWNVFYRCLRLCYRWGLCVCKIVWKLILLLCLLTKGLTLWRWRCDADRVFQATGRLQITSSISPNYWTFLRIFHRHDRAIPFSCSKVLERGICLIYMMLPWWVVISKQWQLI